MQRRHARDGCVATPRVELRAIARREQRELVDTIVAQAVGESTDALWWHVETLPRGDVRGVMIDGDRDEHEVSSGGTAD